MWFEYKVLLVILQLSIHVSRTVAPSRPRAQEEYGGLPLFNINYLLSVIKSCGRAAKIVLFSSCQRVLISQFSHQYLALLNPKLFCNSFRNFPSYHFKYKMSIGVPIKVLHEAEGHIVTCETITGEVYRGKSHFSSIYSMILMSL